MGKLLDFIFGRAPDIFDADGNIVHKLGPEKWKKWQDRFAKNQEFDWHQHRGQQRRDTPKSNKN